MSYGIALHVWGEYACFTRPEMKVERVSYDVMTPSAARGIVSAIYWKKEINWAIDRIHVLKPIRFVSIRRNELGGKIPQREVSRAMRPNSTDKLYTLIEEDRRQRAATVLREVAYIIEAHFTLTGAETPENTPAKHISVFNRRAQKGQCFQQPCLGTREFPAHFAWLDRDRPETFPVTELKQEQQHKDLGLMLHHIDFADEHKPYFFKAQIKGGIIEVPRFRSAGVIA